MATGQTQGTVKPVSPKLAAATSEQPKEIQLMFEDLERRLSMVKDEVNYLEERISPVLRPELPEEAKTIGPEECNTPVGQRLAYFVNEMSLVCSYLNSLKHRVEL